jgi:protein TonB
MTLRCLLFTSDAGTAQPVLQVLAVLGFEAEHCPTAALALEKAAQQAFQLVILDWDNQPEAAMLLGKARERKASERPLTLAVVSHDLNVPQALQAGANSILRKPIQENQARDTLTTARDLMRAKMDPSAARRAPAMMQSPGLPAAVAQPLRAGEFLQSSPPAPGTQFVTDSDMEKSLEQMAGAEVDPLKELEPMAASVEADNAAAEQPGPPTPDEPRGLSWYLATRAGRQADMPASPVPVAAKPEALSPELLSYDQHVSDTGAPTHENEPDVASVGAATASHADDPAKEKALFAYIAGESPEEPEAGESRVPRWLRAVAVCCVVVLGCAIGYWKLAGTSLGNRMHSAVHNVIQAGRNWLNPQPVTPPQAPAAHENFARAGDEYKLPVAETIPDASTDPSQIRVIPAVDPTAKQPKGADANPSLPSEPPGPSATASDQPADAAQQPTPSTAPQPATTDPFVRPVASPPTAPNIQVRPKTEPARTSQPRYIPAATSQGIPSSLKSQMASSTPEASGNKSPETALPAIEPVELPEATARGLLVGQSSLGYPASAKGQRGTVVLQVLIGRDGSVQDAKFLQGSLLFARTAIDGVRQWRFQPYVMNGRPVSVQTQLTLSFAPGS